MHIHNVEKNLASSIIILVASQMEIEFSKFPKNSVLLLGAGDESPGGKEKYSMGTYCSVKLQHKASFHILLSRLAATPITP